MLTAVGIQSAINVGCACFIFPQTVSHKYLTSMISVLQLIKDGVEDQARLLSLEPANQVQWKEYRVIQEKVQEGKAIFIGMIPMEDFLGKEISYSRVRGKALKDLKTQVRKLLNGLGISPKKTNVRGLSLLVLSSRGQNECHFGVS
jgi:Putative ER transporter, 6TM, N-terminal